MPGHSLWAIRIDPGDGGLGPGGQGDYSAVETAFAPPEQGSGMGGEKAEGREITDEEEGQGFLPMFCE
jgi:hypothetical protein